MSPSSRQIKKINPVSEKTFCSTPDDVQAEKSVIHKGLTGFAVVELHTFQNVDSGRLEMQKRNFTLRQRSERC
jgi:hypothetical protein